MDQLSPKLLRFLPKPLSEFISQIISPNTPQGMRHQNICITIYVCTLFIGMLATILGLTGPQVALLSLFNKLFFLTICLLIGLFLMGKLKVETAFVIFMMGTQFFTSVEMVYCAFHPSNYYMMLLIGNMYILAINHLFALLTFRTTTSLVLGIWSAVVYIACMIISSDSSLINFCLTYIFIFAGLTLLGHNLQADLLETKEKNAALEEEQEDDRALLSLFRMERKNIRTFAKLAKEQHSELDAERLLNMLDNSLQTNIIANVQSIIQAKEMEQVQLEQIFPSLTQSELQIAKLVLQGKTLKETCKLLGKTESNITVQRTNIRKKLGLQTSDNLRAELRKRVEGLIPPPPPPPPQKAIDELLT